MSTVRQQLSMAACTLLTLGSTSTQTFATENLWQIDTSYLSYEESDDRVSVSKALANLTRSNENGSVTVNLVHDTISGASPTGAIRSSDSAVTYTGASGGNGFSADNSGDYSKSAFDDTRIQAGVNLTQLRSHGLTFNYGAAVSQESDYDSYGANIGIAKESADRATTLSAGLAVTIDSIYRSDTGGTPEPLGNIQQIRPYSEGSRDTVDGILGYSHVLNKNTLAQLNLGFGASDGYHSDPYKIISAATDEDRILANFHDSRPESRLRTSVFGKLVHQLQGTTHSVHLSYRYYRDDWGIRSHTADLRYRHQLNKRHYLEPHVRLYRQSQADFYQRNLLVDEDSNPILPSDGFASSDYRLDSITSSTLGIKYGVAVSRNADIRLRAEYLHQRFDTADYSSNSAVILQASFRYQF